MKKEHALTKTSFVIDVAAIITLIVYFMTVAPYSPVGLGGLLIMSPPVFGIPGLITAILGRAKSKTKLSVGLMAFNIILIGWGPVMWIGGTLLLGP